MVERKELPDKLQPGGMPSKVRKSSMLISMEDQRFYYRGQACDCVTYTQTSCCLQGCWEIATNHHHPFLMPCKCDSHSSPCLHFLSMSKTCSVNCPLLVSSSQAMLCKYFFLQAQHSAIIKLLTASEIKVLLPTLFCCVALSFTKTCFIDIFSIETWRFGSSIQHQRRTSCQVVTVLFAIGDKIWEERQISYISD